MSALLGKLSSPQLLRIFRVTQQKWWPNVVSHDDKRTQQGDDMHKYLLSAAVGIVGVFALATTASAAVVCNADGDCWRVKEKYDYRPDWGLTVYDDNWKWEGNKYRWRDPGPGRGYYRGGVWIPF
jgi:hypothetical protein